MIAQIYSLDTKQYLNIILIHRTEPYQSHIMLSPLVKSLLLIPPIALQIILPIPILSVPTNSHNCHRHFVIPQLYLVPS